MSGALAVGLKYSRETDLDHQSWKERDDECQHRIHPNPHHADLVGENVAALLGGGLNGHRAFTLDQAAHDFHSGGDTVDLSFADGSLTRLVKALGFLAAGIEFGPDCIHPPCDRV